MTLDETNKRNNDEHSEPISCNSNEENNSTSNRTSNSTQKRSFDQISDNADCQVEMSEDSKCDKVCVDISDNASSKVNEKKIVKEPINFKVVYAKETYEISMDLNDTISCLKDKIYSLTSVSNNLQKLCFKGILVDTKTLKDSGIKDGTKIMMIGSKMNDILAVSTPKEIVKESVKEPTTTKEPLCQQKIHKKIIDKGVPEQVMSAWINEDCALPFEPLTGMVNKYGNKVRITFKLEQDELWISTKERTQKIPMSSIKSVISEPIEGHNQYHLMAFQIGPTEVSRIWFYWVPAQYVKAIKNIILNS